jgi:hypothetical protein
MNRAELCLIASSLILNTCLSIFRVFILHVLLTNSFGSSEFDNIYDILVSVFREWSSLVAQSESHKISLMLLPVFLCSSSYISNLTTIFSIYFCCRDICSLLMMLILSRVWWYARRKWRVLVRIIGFISTSVTHSLLITLKYSAIADLHIFQFTATHALGFPVFTSRLLATDLNSETITVSLDYVFNYVPCTVIVTLNCFSSVNFTSNCTTRPQKSDQSSFLICGAFHQWGNCIKLLRVVSLLNHKMRTN